MTVRRSSRHRRRLKKTRQKDTCKTLTGVVKRHPDGFGFLIPEDSSHPDVYLSRRKMHGVMNNDQVKIAVLSKKKRRNLLTGQVLQIIKRFYQNIIGQYSPLSSTQGVIKDDSFQWGEDLKICLAKNQKIKSGQWVEAKITHWPDHSQGFTGQIMGELGRFSSGLEDNVRVVQKHNIPFVFSKKGLKLANQLPSQLPAGQIPNKALKDRKDLRHLPFVTIDGETAEDFDDAIYVSNGNYRDHHRDHRFSGKSSQSHWKLYIAIADVSYYVLPQSHLDELARQRGNSTYFPKFVVPMLPERLSNDLCSLKPGVDRLVFVVETHFNSKGQKKRDFFYPAVIKSQARFNYGQAQEIMDKASLPKEIIAQNVFNSAVLARCLLKKRLEQSFINLEIPETEVLLNQLGEPLDIIQNHRLFSHQVIEELMLSANRSVAEFLFRKKVPSLYRIHPAPKADSLKFLESFAGYIGRKVILSPPHLQKKISNIIETFSNHPLSVVFHILVLRSLSQAVYSASQKDHFGLNFKYYTHFTSPIRRYSDLIVHRILKAVLRNKKPPYGLKELEHVATWTSACEQRSVKAERQIKDIKKARFLKKHLGEQMDGWISSVVKFGFFVRLRIYDIEGMVRIKNLPGKWDFEESLLQLYSQTTGKRFKIGDFVRIQVMSSNIETGQIDFDYKRHLKK